MAKRKLLLVVSILMLAAAVPFSLLSLQYPQQLHYIAEAGDEAVMPQLPEREQRKEAGKYCGAVCYLLSAGAGMAGLAEHKKRYCRVCRYFAGFLVLGNLLCLILLQFGYLFVMPLLGMETLFYIIGIRNIRRIENYEPDGKHKTV